MTLKNHGVTPGAGGGGGTLVPKAWRLPITQAYDSGNDAALRSALVGSETTKARPSFTIAPNATRTIAVKLGAVAAPGGILSYVADQSGFSVAARLSTDSPDLQSGTWSTIPANIVFPAGGSSSQGSQHKRQVVRVPNAAAAGSVVELTFTAPAAGLTISGLMAHQLQAGLQDISLTIGASLEGYGMRSLDLEASIMAAYPDRDPVCLLYAVGGVTSSTIQNYPAAVTTAWGDLFRMVMVGNIIGNDISDAQPISDDTPASLTALRSRVDAILNGFAGKSVAVCRTTYRAYSGVSPAAPDNGSLPYNVQIIDPAVQADQPASYEAELSIPRVDLYGAAQRNRALLTDQVHFGTTDGSGYGWMRGEWVRSAYAWFYTGSWPVGYAERFVQIAEASRTYTDRTGAAEAVNALPSTAKRTQLLNRLAAIVPLFAVNDNLNGTAGVDIIPHNADTGQPALRHMSYGSGRTWFAPSGDRVYHQSTGTECIYYDDDPGTANYDVDAYFEMQGTVVENNFFAAGRINTGANTMYIGGYTTGTGWTIGKVVGGTLTTLVSTPATLAANTAYKLRLRMVDGNLTLFLNEVQVLTTTDTAITDKGKAGFRLTGSAVSTGTTGAHLTRLAAQAA